MIRAGVIGTASPRGSCSRALVTACRLASQRPLTVRPRRTGGPWGWPATFEAPISMQTLLGYRKQRSSISGKQPSKKVHFLLQLATVFCGVFTLHTLHFTLYTLHFPLNTLHPTLHSTLHTPHSYTLTLCTPLFTLYTSH